LFSKQTLPMANRYIKRSSISAIIREMHIKSTRDVISHQLEDLSAHQKTRDTKVLQGCQETGTFVHCWYTVGISLVQPPWKMVCKFYKKLKMELPYHPASSLLNTHAKKMKSGSQRDICTFVFITTLIHSSLDMETI